MKLLSDEKSNNKWQSALLEDLTFIKEKHRYPISRLTVTPASIAAAFYLFTAHAIFPLFLAERINNTLVSTILVCISITIVVVVIWQYVRMLRFDTIPVNMHVQENIKALQTFLTSNHLAITRHPDAPEVFMIISRNLDTNPKKDFREVMVFIADDKQILVNGHFTGTGFKIKPPSRNYRRMSKQLKSWLNEYIRNNDAATTTVKRF